MTFTDTVHKLLDGPSTPDPAVLQDVSALRKEFGDLRSNPVSTIVWEGLDADGFRVRVRGGRGDVLVEVCDRYGLWCPATSAVSEAEVLRACVLALIGLRD
jgi:hypothetical protein